MKIKVPHHLIKNQEFETAVRFACDELSSQGITNYFHNKIEPRVVELFTPPVRMLIAINCKESEVVLYCPK